MSISTLSTSVENSRVNSALARFSKTADSYSEPRSDFYLIPQTAVIFNLYIENMCRFVELFTSTYPVVVQLIETQEDEAHYIVAFTEQPENPAKRLEEILEQFLPLCKQFSDDEKARLLRIQGHQKEMEQLEAELALSRQQLKQTLDQIINRDFEIDPIF